MSKITFRADDDLVDRLEGLDTSKSEAMREALRAYLDSADRGDTASTADAAASTEGDAETSIDGVIRERVDELVTDRLDALLDDRLAPVGRSRDLNVNVTVDGVNASETRDTDTSAAYAADTDERKTKPDPAEAGARDGSVSNACNKCGEAVDDDHMYCPNCGEKASHRVFCECGDEIRSDWAFCPGCGRRTSAADVLDRP
jgi:RNA polymerase subunit RPABC4/transcription elongation factor Spt4/predicted transcriptional regulator